jgi:phage terminase small subunit
MTPKQERFCLEYARTGNATESYRLAGFKYKNDNCAGVSANQLLKNPKIQNRLQELTAEVKTNKIADVTESLELLSEIARDRKQKGITRVQALDKLLKAQGAYQMQLNLNSVAPVILKDDVSE